MGRQRAARRGDTFRLTDELIERLDAYAERLSEETGLEVTRADVVKRL